MSLSHAPPRRALLVGAAVLAGCSRPEPVTSVPPSAPTATPPTATPNPPAATAPPASPTLPDPVSPPTREQIVARYADRSPTEWGTEVTGVVSRLHDLGMRSDEQRPKVALTFDACGGGGAGDGYDAALVEVLRAHSVPATLFLNARWIQVHEDLAAQLAADPLFLVACHGTRHVPLSVNGREAYGIRGTGSVGEVYDEVAGNVSWFGDHLGRRPQLSRPGTAHSDEIAAAIARDLEMPIAGFSVNGDGGATFSSSMVASTLRTVQDGDIVLAHVNRPGGGTAQGCAEAIPELLDRGVEFVTMG